MATISPDGLRDLVKHFEGCRLTAYQDSVGVWTIGWGHTGSDVHPGMTITQDQADALLVNDVAAFATAVEGMIVHPATQGQFDALVSFAYNLGAGALHGSTLLAKFNAGDMKGAAREFGEWVHAGDAILLGLVRRRVAEVVAFLS